jgi:hypothetical protein
MLDYVMERSARPLPPIVSAGGPASPGCGPHSLESRGVATRAQTGIQEGKIDILVIDHIEQVPTAN